MGTQRSVDWRCPADGHVCFELVGWTALRLFINSFLRGRSYAQKVGEFGVG